MATLHALLLTDVVDSTRLTEQLDEAAGTALWSAHDRIARDLIPLWRGREIDKTDGMLLLFEIVELIGQDSSRITHFGSPGRPGLPASIDKEALSQWVFR